ncbi:hypothetical protein IDH50_16115 [Aeromicrobium tamlense]|uniref:Bacterial Ig domain-containing protein n=1 Tax=Aeromicrobium tamlense TaxID=375541 RepID=A0A8I0FZE2_9ACTN|nr:hypothetical protein [Aeromicrobium tamlense]MBD1271771.1 hypothetical protein [Aeromicrobium tamlense]NYI39041.1 hypothetical protein [Aeromicrobium tamlense]
MKTVIRAALVAVIALIASLLMAPAGATTLSHGDAAMSAPAAGGTISGRMTLSAGVATDAAFFVTAERRTASGAWVWAATSRAVRPGHTYTVTVDSPGTYRVRAERQLSSSSDFKVVTVSKGVARTGVDLLVKPNRTISGTVAAEGFTLRGLNVEMPVRATVQAYDSGTWVDILHGAVSISGVYVLSIPHPYDEVRLRFGQAPCPDLPEFGCKFGTAPVALTTYWDGSRYGTLNAEQALAVDLRAGDVDEIDLTLTPAKHFTVATAPRITGPARLGATMTAVPGRYAPTPSAIVYEWYTGDPTRAGEYDTLEATGPTFTVTPAEVGRSIVLRARPLLTGYEGPTHTSPEVVARSQGSLAVKAKAGKRKAAIAIRVDAPGVDRKRVDGKASVYAKGKRLKTVNVRDGRATIKIYRQKKGKRTYTIRWSGSSSVASATKSTRIAIR